MAKSPPRGFKRVNPKPLKPKRAKAPWGYRRVDVRDEEGAASWVGVALYGVIERFQSEFPYQYAQPRVHLNRDGSVDGELRISGFETGVTWKEFLFRLSSYNQWPKSKDGDFGDFWFSIQMTFNVPDRRAYRELDERYQRYKGGWATSTTWRHSNRGASTFIDVAKWGKKHNKSAPELLEQEKYGYTVQSIALRLNWNPGNEQPKWR